MSEEITQYIYEANLEFTVDDLNTSRIMEIEVTKGSLFLWFGWNMKGRLVIHFLSPMDIPKEILKYIVLRDQLCLPEKSIMDREKIIVNHVASCGAHRYHEEETGRWIYPPLHLFRIVEKNE